MSIGQQAASRGQRNCFCNDNRYRAS